MLKCDGGPIGLFKDEISLESFGVRAPVVIFLVSEFEEDYVNLLKNVNHSPNTLSLTFIYVQV